MATEKHENDDYMDEEGDDFKTPQRHDKKKKKKNKKTENNEPLDVTVKQISDKADRISPIVAYFASGYDPCSQSPKVTVYRHKVETKKRIKVVVSPPGSNVEFVGSNFTGEQSSRQTCVYTLGVLDKETQTLKIVPIAYNKVVRLETRVKGNEAGEEEAAEGAVATEDEADTNLHTFWTKRAILDDKKRRARVLRDDPEGQKTLEGKLEKVDVNTSALENTSALVARNIPHHNAFATNPRDAYPIEHIIENGDWSSLQDVYRLLQEEAGAAKTDAYPAFVRNRLYRLRDNKDETEKETVAGILTFITHLIKFKDDNTLVGRDSARGHKFPPSIREKCKRLFMDSDAGWRMPDDKTNLLISYVLVLTLHVDKFKTDFEDIAKDLRMSSVDLRKHFENLGCKFAVENSIRVATLPVPLKFPEIMRRRKRQR
ncbi:unnamed protein product [Eruca vesicaria subsp. sativa]|uniref:DNA-directed RNA polymerase I subunit rpa49 n=1 Tax=Eruca vesicaria subsp. sativa TaxID=29727 RepID=A0ABC8KVA9_ERUVS|nr:unnamed protein product [Eruca vesicaria subsp. sativa]